MTVEDIRVGEGLETYHEIDQTYGRPMHVIRVAINKHWLQKTIEQQTTAMIEMAVKVERDRILGLMEDENALFVEFKQRVIAGDTIERVRSMQSQAEAPKQGFVGDLAAARARYLDTKR